jgi:predicted nucleic acid-binding protein
VALQEEAAVATHPFVIGELACGDLRNRERILGLLNELPGADVAEHAEVLRFVATERLSGTGLGWIDAHLLASARLASCSLWTRDKALAAAAKALGLAESP